MAGVMLLTAVAPSGAAVREDRSRRSSVCHILVKHSEQKFADEIEKQFMAIPVGDRFNDHNLSVRCVKVDKDNKKVKEDHVTAFVVRNKLASRLVAKWFDRDILTGECTFDTVASRGLYDASVFDREVASRSVRGQAMLEDAGEDLIGNTYLLMHEVNYVDKAKRSRVWGIIGAIAMGALMGAGGASANQISNTMNNVNNLISSYKGFTVKIKTRLYQLDWNDEVAGEFYREAFATVPDEGKKAAFEGMRDKFRMRLVGEVVSKGGRTSFLGINEDAPEIMIRKACARAIDENVVDLQKKFEPFRIKSPITAVGNEIVVPIGKKEGVSSTSKFEVLEMEEKDGKVKYKRVGTVKPISGKIWDNRFMAAEEGAANAGLGYTAFTKTSGGDFVPGMVIREIK